MSLDTVILSCEIFPKKKALNAKIFLKFTEIPKQLELIINPDLDIKNCKIRIGNQIIDIDFQEDQVSEDCFIKTSKLLKFNLPQDLKQDEDEFFIFETEYLGNILSSEWDLSRIEDNFVELASYGTWYPIPLKVGRYNFELTLTSPKEWTWISNSELVKKESMKAKTVWYWKDENKKIDITLLGIPIKQAYKKEGSIFWGLKETVEKNSIYEEYLLERIKALEDWLGPIKSKTRFHYAFTPRDKGGQYSRDGLIATVKELPTEEDMVSRVLQGMIHEVSHAWWNKTSVYDYHNWLDEALAEITSSIIVAEKFGGDQWLDNRATRVLTTLEKAGELPAIRDTSRTAKDAYVLFYYRGFLLFYEIMKRTGKKLFMKIIQGFASYIEDKDSIYTENFLDFLFLFEKNIDFDIHKLIHKWLRYEGKGIPK
jgi:hypothetical protein